MEQSGNKNKEHPSVPAGDGGLAHMAPAVAGPGEPVDLLELVLSVRNPLRELNDIRFDFLMGQDTSQAVAGELVAARLVDGRDLVCIAACLDRIMEKPSIGNSETFALSSGCMANEVANAEEYALIGYAQITITYSEGKCSSTADSLQYNIY